MMMSPITATPHAPGEAEFRQLRHQTKNALQRIMCQIAACRDLQATPQGARLVDDLERRVRLSSTVSGEAEFRQLRHQTKNALQRIMCQIAACRDLQATPQGARLVDDLERRVRLSSTVSDALFGVTTRPGPLPDRLRRLCDATIELMGDPDQMLTLQVAADPAVPRLLDDTVLRIVHEFVGNSVKHGLYARSVGAVTVRVTQEPRRITRVTVVDDGWGFACAPEPGEGSRLASLLAERHGGTTTLIRRGGVTVAEAVLSAAGIGAVNPA